MSTMPGLAQRIGPRIGPEGLTNALAWGQDALALDSLARLQLATAAAVWCNAYDVGFEDLFLAKRSVADWAHVMLRVRTAGAAQFTFSTSGSAGARKHIRHREDTLLAEARTWAEVFKASATPVQRIVLLAPSHHIYGFIWGVLLPTVLNVPVIDAELTGLPCLLQGDLVVAVPDQWHWLANTAAMPQRWPPGVTGVSSTAPLAAATHRALIEPISPVAGAALSRLLQIYGSTETAGIAWRDTPDGDYQLAQGRTRNDAGQIELILPGGQHAVLAVQDELHWRDRTHFELLRRTDASVQVGGHNVSPTWVEDKLRSHFAVKDAAVRLDAHATPPRLKAFVVLTQPDDLAARQRLETWMTEVLPWYAAPNAVAYGTELPRKAMGKPSDWAPD